MTDFEIFYEVYTDTHHDKKTGEFSTVYTYKVLADSAYGELIARIEVRRNGFYEVTPGSGAKHLTVEQYRRVLSYFNASHCLSDGELMSAECLNGASGNPAEMPLTEEGRMTFCSDLSL